MPTLKLRKKRKNNEFNDEKLNSFYLTRMNSCLNIG